MLTPIECIRRKIKEAEVEMKRLNRIDQILGREYYEGRRDAYKDVLGLLNRKGEAVFLEAKTR